MSVGSLIFSRLGSAVSQVTRSYFPHRLRYLPLCTNVPWTSILVSNKCFHRFQVRSSNAIELCSLRFPLALVFTISLSAVAPPRLAYLA